MFDLDRFIEECRAAMREDPSHKAVREIVGRAVSDPAAVLGGLGEPKRAEIGKLYHAPDLTILNVVWGPHMTIRPHNHMMWAVIGIYTGREDNIFWRRIADAPDGRIEAASAKSLGAKTAEPLGSRHRSHGHQSAAAADRRDPCLWRRFLRDPAQRMESREPVRSQFRPALDNAALRAGKCRLSLDAGVYLIECPRGPRPTRLPGRQVRLSCLRLDPRRSIRLASQDQP